MKLPTAYRLLPTLVLTKLPTAYCLLPTFILCLAHPLRCAATNGDTAASNATALYRAECAGCHGEKGDGNGKADSALVAPPRDFTRGKFKLRTTDPRKPVTVEELNDVITDGIPGTSMPSFRYLSAAQRLELARYVRRFAVADSGVPATPIVIGTPPATTPELIAAGRKQYDELGCPACHGPEGRGDGPAASALKDEWGHVDPARDLVRDPFRGGHSDQQVYLRLAIGMPGTPMPGYADVANEHALWALVAYLQSIRQPPPSPPSDPIALGKAVFASQHCLACHQRAGAGGHVGPSLDGVIARRGVPWLEAFLANPRPEPKVDPTSPSRMPQLNMTPAEIDGVVRYLASVQP